MMQAQHICILEKRPRGLLCIYLSASVPHFSRTLSFFEKNIYVHSIIFLILPIFFLQNLYYLSMTNQYPNGKIIYMWHANGETFGVTISSMDVLIPSMLYLKLINFKILIILFFKLFRGCDAPPSETSEIYSSYNSDDSANSLDDVPVGTMAYYRCKKGVFDLYRNR